MDALNNLDLRAFLTCNLKGDYFNTPDKLALITINNEKMLRIINTTGISCCDKLTNFSGLNLRKIAKFVSKHQDQWYQQSDERTKLKIEKQCAQLQQIIDRANLSKMKKIVYNHPYTYLFHVTLQTEERRLSENSFIFDRATTIYEFIETLHKLEHTPATFTICAKENYTIDCSPTRIFRKINYDFGNNKVLKKIYENFVAKKQKMPDLKFQNRYIIRHTPRRDLHVKITYSDVDQLEALAELKRKIDKYVYEHTVV